MGAHRRFSSLALFALALTAWGCGSSFKLPTERRESGESPTDKSYQVIATWTGLPGVVDALLIPGPQLYLAFAGNPGRVYETSTFEPRPLALDRFQTVQHPARLAASATSVFVLDLGDTAAARATGDSTTWYELDCGPMRDVRRTIVDLSSYWYVREFDLKGRTQRSAFTDTTFAWVNGIAADAQGRVYVSGVIFHCYVDIYDARLRTLDFEDRIHRYEPGGGDRFVIGGWKRSADFGLANAGIAEGTGIGSTHDPRGMTWSSVTGAALYFADLGNNEFQKFDLAFGSPNSFKQDFCPEDNTALVQPIDVDVDPGGNVYVVDSGNRRVLRYTANGDTCRQRVDIEGGPLTLPVAVAAGDFDEAGTIRNFVYVVDPPDGRVIVYRRRL